MTGRKRPSRRNILAAALAPAFVAASPAQEPAPKIYLNDWLPKSMLVVEGHHLTRARYPLIDVHTHMSHIFGMHIFAAAGQSTAEPADMNAARQRVLQLVG